MRKTLPLLAFATMVACGSADASDAPENEVATEVIVTVDTIPAVAEQRPRVLELAGTLEANRRASLSPQVSGHVSQVLVERGTEVEEGDALIVLQPADLRLAAQAASARAESQLRSLGFDSAPSDEAALDDTPAVAAARADWETAKDRRDRSESLVQSGAIDPQTWQQIQAGEEAARARYESARQQARASLASYQALRADAAMRRRDAADATLRAPFAGAVMSRSVEIGEFVGPQTPVVELIDASQLRLELDVPERYSTGIQEGQTLSVAVDGTDLVLEATVRFVAAAIDTQRRTLTIEAVVDNADGQVRAGHFGRARIALGGARELMKVPSSALVERAGVNRIYVAVDGVAEARIVEVIERAGDEVWVEGTLADGEQVLVSPGRDIADGVGIEPHPVASNQPLSTGDPNPQPNQPDPSGPRAEG
ncbi:MAG: efflux RND transporter periplasmic adaptor subunit [Deltaproteobacteria bacterium]|nr:efflux RND transporter periplasmic adaptor subunit [Deltaproteobacteria bacterium]